MTDGPARDLVGYGRVPPGVEWPEGALVVVNLVLVYEEGSERGVAEADAVNDGWGEYEAVAAAPVRDLGTETHYEYGSRAGIWRLARLVDGMGIPATVSATAVALERNAEVGSWMLERGHDLLGHGWRWLPQWELTRTDEAGHLDRAIETYERVLGVRPAAYGWNSRSFPSVNTRELLAERDFLYDSDPCNDDIPYWVRSAGRDLLVVPYSKTLNDSRYLVAPGFASPRDFVEHCAGALDELVREAAGLGGRMATIALHARWSGQPARASAVRAILDDALARPEVRVVRRSEIARWWVEREGRA